MIETVLKLGWCEQAVLYWGAFKILVKNNRVPMPTEVTENAPDGPGRFEYLVSNLPFCLVNYNSDEAWAFGYANLHKLFCYYMYYTNPIEYERLHRPDVSIPTGLKIKPKDTSWPLPGKATLGKDMWFRLDGKLFQFLGPKRTPLVPMRPYASKDDNVIFNHVKNTRYAYYYNIAPYVFIFTPGGHNKDSAVVVKELINISYMLDVSLSEKLPWPSFLEMLVFDPNTVEANMKLYPLFEFIYKAKKLFYSPARQQYEVTYAATQLYYKWKHYDIQEEQPVEAEEIIDIIEELEFEQETF
jgi:hypothetical protein